MGAAFPDPSLTTAADMWQAIGDVLPMAIGVALSPVPVIAMILMLITPKARNTRRDESSQFLRPATEDPNVDPLLLEELNRPINEGGLVSHRVLIRDTRS